MSPSPPPPPRPPGKTVQNPIPRSQDTYNTHSREDGHPETALENYEALLRLAERLGDAKRGLDREHIKKLPSIKCKHRYDTSQTWCVVCMTDFQEEDMVS